MEHCHFSITQLSMNKGKLAATNHICSFICENSLPSDCDLFYIFIVKFLHHYVYFDVLMKCCERLFRTSAHDPLHCKTIVSWAFTTFQLIMVSLKWQCENLNLFSFSFFVFFDRLKFSLSCTYCCLLYRLGSTLGGSAEGFSSYPLFHKSSRTDQFRDGACVAIA